MASSSEIKQLKKAFGEFECDDDMVWHSAAGLSRQLGLAPPELAEQLELFALNKKKLGEPITKHFFSIFSEHLKREKAKENVAGNTSHGASSAFNPPAAPSPLATVVKPQFRTPVTPGPAAASSLVHDVDMADTPPPPTTAPASFNLKVTPIFNGGVPDRGQASGEKLQCNGPHLPVPFRTLSSFLPAAASHLERRITTMEAHLRSTGWNLTAVNTSSTENVAVVGRICHSADSATSTLATLELEGSRAVSDGARVKVDCSLLTTCSFFPGQVVGIKGRNPTGSCLTVHSVVDTFPAADSPAAENVVEQAAPAHSRIVIAAGPFVPGTGKLSFQALHAVLKRCRAVQPDSLLLCGPFIPDNHPALKTLRVTFHELFAQQVLAPLQEFSQQCPQTQVMLLPATADVHHTPVHPQPAMPSVQGVEMLPSPAHLQAGSSAVTVSSSSVLFDLSSTAVGQLVRPLVTRSLPFSCKGRWLARCWSEDKWSHECCVQAGQDRISRLFQHVLQQSHMYPIFPPALNACVDYAHTQHLDLPYTPNVLMLPAPFPACVKLVQARSEGPSSGTKTVCINPGYACKGTSGTFIDMLLPNAADAGAQEAKVSSVQWTEAGS